jgi:hypothetical protein
MDAAKTQTQTNGTQAAPPQSSAIQPAQPRIPLGFVPDNVDEALRLARMFCAASELLPDALKGKPECVVLVMLMGKEFGMSPVQSLRHIYVVKGRPQLSSAFKIGLVRQSPDCEYIKCVDSTDTSATWESKRRSESAPNRVTFTIEDAKNAGLLSGGPNSPWQSYRRRMLAWRAGSELADREWSEVTGNIDTRDPGDPALEDRGFLERIVPETTAPPPPPPLSVQVGLAPAPANDSPAPAATAASTPASPSGEANAAAPGDVPEVKHAPIVEAEPDPIEVEVAAIKRALDGCKTKRDAQALIPRINALPPNEKADVSRHYEQRGKSLPAR